ncbi:MFS transporter [Curtobacterium oceanosedimentum]|uniref:MFS transporter n=1 Tax=Curtobacterium oceanosedimentum TaxID=465820 RepID=UPI001CE18B2C|nr:MFS transporter [Curtobacterium oceanosedimentum]MCA5923096.1 MFS transporter [Curtobacterium oceanosedimentum]
MSTGGNVPVGLVALALGGFGIGLTEFVILGLLPEVAADFSVTIPQAGYLVSGYAVSVAFGGVFVTAATASMRPKTVLSSLMVLFIIGNLLSAVAPTYSAMLVGRVVAALCHGAFFGIGSVLAASLVQPDRRARAISTMFLGLTVANVLGVPLGTFLGQALGWRSTFWAITGIGVVALVGLLAFIPGQEAEHRPAGQLRRELAAFRSGQVWLSICVTVFGFGAMFGTFTYIAPILTDVAGMPTTWIPWMLVLFGSGLFVGNLVGGRAADRDLDPALLTLLASLTVVLVVFSVVASNPWAAGGALFLLGAVGFASVPGMQMRVLRFAEAAPTLASGVNISAFNAGNAIGAWLGGLTIAAGLGYRSPIVVGALLAATAFALIVIASGAHRRRVVTHPPQTTTITT